MPVKVIGPPKVEVSLFIIAVDLQRIKVASADKIFLDLLVSIVLADSNHGQLFALLLSAINKL